MIGRTISHYKILEKLGEGGMGVVYKAEDTKLKRIVALKFLSPQAMGTDEERLRFIHEAQSAAALNHPNICTIYEIDEADGRSFIAMEYVDGRSLKSLIAERPMELDGVIDMAQQLAAGLREAHAKGIVHRDIKPANIMLTTSGRAKIMDFGLAKSARKTQLTMDGSTVGTVAYMSPEQGRGETVDQRSDIWSLGVVLYEAVSGRLPFRGEHEQAIIYSVLNEDPEPVTAIRSGVPMELERVFNKAMAKRPEERYQHLDDLLVDLKAVKKQIAVQDQVKHVSGAADRAAAAGKTNRRRAGYLIGAIVLMSAVIILTWVLSYWSERSGDGEVAGAYEDKTQSLAVLPFDNLMNDPKQDYFVDGMHEALITSLSKLGSLRVISRTSVMRYKNTEKAMTEIARELDVDVLIEGSVLRAGDEVQITAQLIDGATDEHLWADNYVRDLQNILSMLNEVAGAIAGEIHATLTPEQEKLLARNRPVDPDAYEQLLRGTQLFNTFKAENVRQSIEYFKRAIAIDPEFPEAYGALASAYLLLPILGSAPAEFMPKASEEANRALELDENLAVGHTVKGYVLLYYNRDWQAGGEEFRRALEIDPNNSMARHGYADYLAALGRLDESVNEVLKGRRADPLSPLTNAVVVGHLYMARRYDEAIAEAEKLLAINPFYPAVKGFIRQSYWQLGRYEEAVQLYREASWANQTEYQEAIDRGYASSGPRGVMRELARLMEAGSDSTFTSPLTIAVYYARAGEADPAMKWLERAERERAPTFIHMLMNPAFDFLRDTPRFQAMHRRLKLPE